MNILEAETKIYFGYKIVAYKSKETSLFLYPWRFRIKINDEWHDYAGIPNKCESKASALKRAWHRAKWLYEGTYHDRYCMIKG